jgi:hypothetical protein
MHRKTVDYRFAIQQCNGKRSTNSRKLVAFFVDLDDQSVVTGPEIFPASKVKSNKPLPELLDGGGNIRAELNGASVTHNIAPRPFTAPVFSDGGENFRKLLEKEPI